MTASALLAASLIAFGATSGKPTESDISEALASLKSVGVNEYMIYPRSGLEYEYMGEDWLDYVGKAIAAAERLGMRIWLYDEFNWPSGSCKGRVPAENPDWANAEWFVTREGDAFRWELRRDPEFGANNYSVAAMNRHRELTHLVYERRFSRHFGKTVAGIMTDEPAHYSLKFRKAGGFHFKWYPELEADYAEATDGRDFKRDVEAFLADNSKGEVFRVYTRNLARRFRMAHFEPTRKWCEKLGMEFTGHMIAESNPFVSAENNGLPLETLATLTVPGADEIFSHVGDRAEWLTFHVLEYAIRKNGRGGLAELFAMGPCDMTFTRMRNMIRFAAGYGVDRFLVSLHQMNVCGYSDPSKWWAMHFSPLQPWFRHLRLLVDAADRAVAEAKSAPAPKVALRYPEADYGYYARLPQAPRRKLAPDIAGTLRVLEQSGVRTLLVPEDDQCRGMKAVLRFSGSGLVDEVSGREFANASDAAEFAAPLAGGGRETALSEGSLPGNPVDAAWKLSFDSPHRLRVRFSTNGTARVRLSRPVRNARLVLRNYPQAVRVAMDGEMVSAGHQCKSIGYAYDRLYLETEPMDIAAGEHAFRLEAGKDDCFFLPVAWLVANMPELGLEGFAGTVTYSADVHVPEGSRALRIDTGDAIASVRVGGESLGVKAFAPWEWTLPAGSVGKTVPVEIAVTTSIRPIFGEEDVIGAFPVRHLDYSFPASLKKAEFVK